MLNQSESDYRYALDDVTIHRIRKISIKQRRTSDYLYLTLTEYRTVDNVFQWRTRDVDRINVDQWQSHTTVVSIFYSQKNVISCRKCSTNNQFFVSMMGFFSFRTYSKRYFLAFRTVDFRLRHCLVWPCAYGDVHSDCIHFPLTPTMNSFSLVA
jgi:hypothetical protein